VLGLADGVVGSLLGSEGGTIFDGLGQESDVVDGGGKLGLGGGQEFLSVSNGSFAFNLSGSVSVSLVGSICDFSITNDQIFIMLSVSLGLLSLFGCNKFINKVNNIINDTFRSKMNL